ncbi:MAG: hypothetical protein MUC48_17355 [Leptolyngbya sp. Prado105]|jgi:hypothetical protein|nr:hypothetical protein [Leptolyngbya sp. Prado105]
MIANLTPVMFSPAEDSLNMASHSQGHSLFAQLRNRFPQGALISELVQVQDGQFVVRAIVQVGTTTLATGMAAAEKIEVAEDRARVRAMEVLGISPTGGSATFDVSARSILEAPKEVEPNLDTPISFTQVEAEIPLPPVEELVPGATAPKKATRKKKEEPPEIDFSAPDFELPDLKSAPPEFTRESLPPVVDFAPDFEEDELPMPDPIDLSDAIAQIGTEIERIGWTKKQGSTYLQDTYGKKTRAELDEDELIEFLHYLKALPSKNSQIPF